MSGGAEHRGRGARQAQTALAERDARKAEAQPCGALAARAEAKHRMQVLREEAEAFVSCRKRCLFHVQRGALAALFAGRA